MLEKVPEVVNESGDSTWPGEMVAGICTFLGTALAAVLADLPPRDLATVTVAAIAFGAAAGWLTFGVMKLVSPARVG